MKNRIASGPTPVQTKLYHNVIYIEGSHVYFFKQGVRLNSKYQMIVAHIKILNLILMQ